MECSISELREVKTLTDGIRQNLEAIVKIMPGKDSLAALQSLQDTSLSLEKTLRTVTEVLWPDEDSLSTMVKNASSLEDSLRTVTEVLWPDEDSLSTMVKNASSLEDSLRTVSEVLWPDEDSLEKLSCEAAELSHNA